ncbi:MAG: sugar ABC transporter permease [Firmicutes bacterium]|nr:sugar ABC transporter permease [Bacillota bacterium]
MKVASLSKARRREALLGFVFCLPWIIGFLVIFVYPMASSLVYSFTNYNGGLIMDFVGFQNYVSAFGSRAFRVALRNSIWWTLVGVVLTTVLGLGMAMLVKPRVHGMKVFRTIYYLPNVLNGVAVVFLWSWVFSGTGPLNAVLGWFGRPPTIFLESEFWSKPALMLMNIWGVGAVLLIYLAALQGVPQELHEAAQVDGAGHFRRFFAVTLPSISGVLMFNIIIGVVQGLGFFIGALLLTNGGPGMSSFFLGQLIYQEAFLQNNFGYANAIGWIVMIIMLSTALLLQKLSKRIVFYMDGA